MIGPESLTAKPSRLAATVDTTPTRSAEPRGMMPTKRRSQTSRYSISAAAAGMIHVQTDLLRIRKLAACFRSTVSRNTAPPSSASEVMNLPKWAC